MCTKAINKLNDIMAIANEFISANAPQMLPKQRAKLIDLTTVSMMGFEDKTFSWEILKNIAVDMVSKYEFGEIPWYIDIDHSNSKTVWITNADTKQSIQIDVANVLLSTMLCVQ